ncbi:MAG TPA: aldose epimerase family protein [Bacteroidales bacterium]|nr:aldose epimerase family protein [Bacteroidales bacterium]
MKLISELQCKLSSGDEVFRFTLENDYGMTVRLTNYGGTLTEVWVPGKQGKTDDVILCYDSIDKLIVNTEPYFGCIVGRTCNRIGGAKFTIDGTEYQVSPNKGDYQLHGGFEGFNKKAWTAKPVQTGNEVSVVLEYFSPDGEEGFPGNLQVKAVYSLNNQNELSVSFYAMTDKPTPVNLTNHAYWNLAGESSGNVLDHQLVIYSDQITETNSNLVPTGLLKPVAGTPYDFNQPHKIGERIDQLYKGYDDNYCLRNLSGKLMPAAKVFDEKSGRLMEILTTEPGMQLYTANWFDGSITGKGGLAYMPHAAFCTETQHYPNSMNIPGFPNVILRPGNMFTSQTIWRFSVADSI